MQVTTSRLAVADAAVVGREHHRIWRATYAGLLPRERLDALDDEESVRRWTARAIEHEERGCSAEGATTWVARDSRGRPVGWMGVGPARDDDAPCDLEVWSLYVVPELWGAAVAATLVEERLPPGPAMLWVLTGNERAVSFYRKCGFELDGATKPLDPSAGPSGGVELRMVRR